MDTKSLRVLMIDDSELDSLLAIRHLSHAGYSPILRREEDEAGTRAALAEEKWDVLFCDSSMPGFGAGKALEMLRNMKLETPLIVVSGSTGQEAAAAAVRLGAVDWVSKRDLSRLVPVVERHIHREEVPSVNVLNAESPALAGSVLHSFNNALSVVLTYASVLLNETPADNPIRADLEEIEKAANTAAALAAGLFPWPTIPKDERKEYPRPEAIALVEERLRKETALLKCEVCGSDRLTAIEYRTPDLHAPALECDRCKAIKLDETVGQSAQERDRIRSALERRATVVRGFVPTGGRDAPRALHDVCDEISTLLNGVRSTLRSLPHADSKPGESLVSTVVSTDGAMRQIAALVESLRTAV